VQRLEALSRQPDLDLLLNVRTLPVCPHTRAVLDWLAEGRQEGEAAVTLRLLNRRCGSLSEATTAQLQALPVETLEALADALLDFQGPADLASWLAANT
jgi:hypothetical protein